MRKRTLRWASPALAVAFLIGISPLIASAGSGPPTPSLSKSALLAVLRARVARSHEAALGAGQTTTGSAPGVMHAATDPAAASQLVTGGVFGLTHNYTKGSGDTWFNTWADDGNVYATSNDTNGFNGTCNSDLTVNELTGNDPTQLTAPFVNCMTSYGYAGDTSQYPDGCDWKSGGITSISGVLYLAVARQTGVCTQSPNGEQPSEDASIVKSTDHGRTWSNGFGTSSDPNGAAPPLDAATGHVMAMFPRNHFSAPFFIQYGQDGNPSTTADGGDQYVYAVSNDGFAYDGSYLYLGRVLRSQIGNLSAADWQYYTGPPGGNGMNPANWSANFSDAKPMLTAKNQISQPSIQYIPALHEYVMINFYYPFSPNWPGNGTASSSNFSFYESPHPWGPWTQFMNKPTNMTVCYMDCQQENTWPMGFYDPALVMKFSRMNGLSNTIFTSGDFTNPSRYDEPWTYELHALPFTMKSNRYVITDDGSTAITYKGSWYPSTWQGVGSDYFDGSQHFSPDPGDSASFTFSGTSIQWIGSTNSNHGYASVSVDGGPPATVDGYSPDWDKQVTLFTRTGLNPGQHTITVTVTGNKNPSSGGTYQDIDAFIAGQAG